MVMVGRKDICKQINMELRTRRMVKFLSNYTHQTFICILHKCFAIKIQFELTVNVIDLIATKLTN